MVALEDLIPDKIKKDLTNGKISKSDYNKLGSDIEVEPDKQYENTEFKSLNKKEYEKAKKLRLKKLEVSETEELREKQRKTTESKEQVERLEIVHKQNKGMGALQIKEQKDNRNNNFIKILNRIDKLAQEKTTKKEPVKATLPEKKEATEKELISLKLSDGKEKKLKIGDIFLIGGKEYVLKGTRVAAKNNRLLIQAQSVLDEKEKPVEMKPSDFEKDFEIGKISLPMTTERSNELTKFREEKNKIKPILLKKKEDVDAEIINEENENPKDPDEEVKNKIAEILKNYKIDEVIVNGPKFSQDLDTHTALFLLNDLNNKGGAKEIYNDGAKSTIIDIPGGQKEPKEKTKGVRIFIDAGGEFIKFEKEGETTTLWLDHHGSGQKEATSGTKMMYEMMQKAGILKENPEWLKKFVDFVDDVDNLKYVDKLDEKGNRIFNENYFKNKWPKSLYALAEKQIPFDQFKVLFELLVEQGKNPAEPFTTEELNGEIGKIVIGDKTLKNLCEIQEKSAAYVCGGVDNALNYAKKNKINLESKRYGRVVYHNFFEITYKDKKTKEIKSKSNTMENFMAYKALKSKDRDTLVVWNPDPKYRSFFINSNFKNANLAELANVLEKKYPGCVKNNGKDVRGIFIFGTITDGMTEKDFLDTLDKEIAKNAVKGSVNENPLPKINKTIINPDEYLNKTWEEIAELNNEALNNEEAEANETPTLNEAIESQKKYEQLEKENKDKMDTERLEKVEKLKLENETAKKEKETILAFHEFLLKEEPTLFIDALMRGNDAEIKKIRNDLFAKFLE